MFSTMVPPRPALRAVHGSLWREPALLLAGAFFLLRLLYLPWINLFPEEAYYWNYAQHLDIGYLDHPPMVAWLIALGTRLGGQMEFGVRVPALVCSAVTSFFAWRLAARLYGRRAAAVAVLLTQLLPFFFMAGWIMTPDAPLTACWAATLYFLARAFFDPVDRAPRAWLGVGICLGLGLLSKYTVALLGPAAMLFLLLDVPSRPWWRRWEPYAAAALAVLIFSPVIRWNLAHHGASFAFQSTSRLRARAEFSLPRAAGFGAADPDPRWGVAGRAGVAAGRTGDRGGHRRGKAAVAVRVGVHAGAAGGVRALQPDAPGQAQLDGGRSGWRWCRGWPRRSPGKDGPPWGPGCGRRGGSRWRRWPCCRWACCST